MNIKYLVAAVTIFDSKGNIDENGNIQLYKYFLNNNVTGVVILGSSGEFYSMPINKKKHLIDIAASTLKNHARLIVGTGCMHVDEVIELSQYAYSKGVKEVIIIPPYYFRLDTDNILNFYNQVAQNVDVNIFVYNFPAVTGYDISDVIISKLIKNHKNIIGYKDTVPDMSHTREIIKIAKQLRSDFEVYSGYDDNIVSVSLSGGNGIIGILPNVAPSIFYEITNAYNKGDLEHIILCQKKIDRLMDLFKCKTIPAAVIKELLYQKGIVSSSYCIEPVTNIDNLEKQRLIQILDSGI